MAAPNAKPTSTPEWASTADTILPWQASTAYLAGDLATNGANVYEVVTAGTSAGSGGPTGTGTAITDNTITWRYLGKAGTAGGITEPSAGRKQTGWLAGEKPPHGYFNWLSWLAWKWTKFLDTFNQYLQVWQNAAVFEGPPAWASTHAYSVGEYVLNDGKVYVCTVAGTSAGSGGPTGTGTGITDGTVTWDYAQLPFDVEVPARFRATALFDQDGAGWVALPLNTGGNWVNAFGDETTVYQPKYRKDSFGRVWLRGRAARTSGSNGTIGTLPAGFRPSPSAGQFVPVVGQSGGVLGAIQIAGNGNLVWVIGDPGGVSDVQLDGIAFYADA